MSVLDEKVIAELNELMGDDYITVFEAFTRSADQAVQELKQAVENNDINAVETITHTLKGSSANIGAKKLSQICADMLEDARNATTVKFNTHLDMVVSEYGDVYVSIKKLI